MNCLCFFIFQLKQGMSDTALQTHLDELGHECKIRSHPSFEVSNDFATYAYSVSELLDIEFNY